MPRGDGTGPMGFGPMSGRGAGYCAEYSTPGFVNSGFAMGKGRGFGRGFAPGMGRRHGGNGFRCRSAIYPIQYKQDMTGNNEVDMLKNQTRYFNDALENINKRIVELETEKKV